MLGVLCFLFSILAVGQGLDQTRQPNSYGPEVVEAVVNTIRSNCIFAADRRFLRRLAYVESHDGTDPKTFRQGYDGGIWQVDQDEFQQTLNNANLVSQYATIRTKLGINWSQVRWSDLRKPLYSGLAAALYTLAKEASSGETINWKVETQGQFWETHFHHGSSATNFTNLASILDLGCVPNQAIDLVFVLDRSSSLSRDDLLRAKYFMTEVVDGFPVGTTGTRVGVVTYADSAKVEFYLNSHLDKTSVTNAIDNIAYVPGSTATADGITTAINSVFSGARADAVKVMIVVTDGRSDDPISTMHAAEAAHNNNYVVFAVGVGSNIGTSELNTISTDPDCTHTYAVNSFEEIRFMKEEIQKATCLAPIVLTHTYSCEISKCPPFLAYNNTTIQTNITCGGMSVYFSSTNPYPSSANFEVVDNSSPGHPTEYYYNSATASQFFITLKDNQLQLTPTGSAGCTAYITPYTGDLTNNNITCTCYQHHLEVPCPKANCTENWNFPNPCTRDNLLAGKDKFPYPYANTKFILCDLSGKPLIGICPPGEYFKSDCSQCIGANVIGSAHCNAPLQTAVANPCTREHILAGLLYFAYPGSETKYIHCDIWGHPWERQCRTGEVWKQDEVTCIVPSGYEPCLHHVPGTPLHYPHQCDPHQYIQCDLNGQSFIKPCELDFLFLPTSRTCVPIGFPGSEGLINTCSGSHNTYTHYVPPATTTAYNAITGGGLISHVQFLEPCTLLNIRANKLYFPYQYNRHQYIQCDLNGYAYLQLCSGSGHDWYDQYSHTCVDGSVQVDPLLTNPPIG